MIILIFKRKAKGGKFLVITAVVVVVTIIATITAGRTSVLHVKVFIVFGGR